MVTDLIFWIRTRRIPNVEIYTKVYEEYARKDPSAINNCAACYVHSKNKINIFLRNIIGMIEIHNFGFTKDENVIMDTIIKCISHEFAHYFTKKEYGRRRFLKEEEMCDFFSGFEK